MSGLSCGGCRKVCTDGVECWLAGIKQHPKHSCWSKALPNQWARIAETLECWSTAYLRKIRIKPTFQQVATRALQLMNLLLLQIQGVWLTLVSEELRAHLKLLLLISVYLSSLMSTSRPTVLCSQAAELQGTRDSFSSCLAIFIKLPGT